MYRKELLKGSTEPHLLSRLAVEPMYGYQLVKEMGKRSGGYFRFKEGTLYPALHRLEKEELLQGKWVMSPSGQPRRHYYITPKGVGALQVLLEEWRSFSSAANLIFQQEKS